MAIVKDFSTEEFLKEVKKIRSNNLKKFVVFYLVQTLGKSGQYFTPEEWEMVDKNPEVVHRLESQITRRILKCGRRTAYDYRKAKELIYRINQEQLRLVDEVVELRKKRGGG